MRSRWLLSLGALGLLSACASAPYSDPASARSLGENKTLMGLGYQSLSGPTLRLDHGITDKLDVGGSVELGAVFNAMGVNSKFALLNRESDDGPSLSVMGGVGSSASKSYYLFAGGGASYKWKMIEPFVFARYNYVINREQFTFDFNGKNQLVPATNFFYPYVNLGFTLWFKDNVGLTLNAGITFKGTRTFMDAYFWNLGGAFQFGI